MADISQLWRALQSARYSLVSLGYLTTLAWLLIRTIVWRTLLQNKTQYTHTFLAINEGYLLNNLLPFRLGELGRSFLLARKSHLPFTAVFSTVLLERILDVGFAASLLLGTIPFVIGVSWARQAALSAGIVVFLGLTSLYVLVAHQEKTLDYLRRMTSRWERSPEFVLHQFEAFLSGITVLKERKRLVLVIVWMVTNWGVAFLQYFIFMRAFFPHAKPLWAAFSLGVTALGIAVPSSPGQVGVLEFAIVWSLSLFQADPSTATALAITLHLSNFLITAILGAWGFTREGETLISIYQKLRHFKTANQPKGE